MINWLTIVIKANFAKTVKLKILVYLFIKKYYLFYFTIFSEQNYTFCFLKYCNEAGLEVTRRKLNRTEQQFVLYMSSLNEMKKFYQMSLNGLQMINVEVDASIDDSEEMIKIIINALRLSQTKVVLLSN